MSELREEIVTLPDGWSFTSVPGGSFGPTLGVVADAPVWRMHIHEDGSLHAVTGRVPPGIQVSDVDAILGKCDDSRS